jgi:AmpD protein
MYKIDLETGFIEEARRVASPNYDERPAGCNPELMVVHGISLPPGEFGADWIDSFFCNTLPVDAHPYFEEIAGLRVSSHFLIRRDGSLTQYVSLNCRAWHAGVSCFEGQEACNDFSIGIGREGEDKTPYEEQQYASLAKLIDTLRTRIDSLGKAQVVGHSDISPGRKTDPGPAFDWCQLDTMLTTGSTKVVTTGVR